MAYLIEIEPDDVLIRVGMCGVCGTDLNILEGKHAFRPVDVNRHDASW